MFAKCFLQCLVVVAAAVAGVLVAFGTDAQTPTPTPAKLISYWTECIQAIWEEPVSNVPLLGYHTELDGIAGPDTVTNAFEFCQAKKFETASFRVQAFSETIVSEWSDPQKFERVHNFDANQTGVTDMLDFGKFLAAYGDCYQDNGLMKSDGTCH